MSDSEIKLIVVLVGVGGALLGTLLGAVVNYWCTKKAEARRNLENLRTQAYLDFLKASLELNVERAVSLDEATCDGIRARLCDSKARICLYGAPEVIGSLAKLETSTQKKDGMGVRYLVELCSVMRHSDGYVALDDIFRVLSPSQAEKK